MGSTKFFSELLVVTAHQRWTTRHQESGTPVCATASKTPTLVRIHAIISAVHRVSLVSGWQIETSLSTVVKGDTLDPSTHRRRDTGGQNSRHPPLKLWQILQPQRCSTREAIKSFNHFGFQSEH